MNDIRLVAGLDIGNGYVKGAARCGQDARTVIDFPSSVTPVVNGHDIKSTGADIGETIKDIFNQADISFDSTMIHDTGRVLFGRRGLMSGRTPLEFDVFSTRSKAEDQLNYMLALGSIAGKALQHYWNKCHTLPTETLRVSACIAVALPIDEYKDFRQAYAANFMNHPHMVSFHNFDQPVRMEITVTAAQVLAEGASAQYAITALGEPLMNAMLKDLRAMGQELPGITSADLLAAQNTIGIDIGEGTVNFPVFQNGKFNPDASMTLDRGFGNVLTDAVDTLKRNAGMPFSNRKALADYLQTQPTAVGMGRYQKAKLAVDEHVRGFAKEVEAQFTRVLNRVGSYTDVIYVYGGGATAVKDILYPVLLESAQRFGGADVTYPVLYLDSRYSRQLNREGLYIVADKYDQFQSQAKA